MPPIWIIILFGVITMPIISTYTKEIEERIEDAEKEGASVEFMFGRVKTKKDAQKLSKLLTMGAIAIFATAAIIMVIFTGGNIK